MLQFSPSFTTFLLKIGAPLSSGGICEFDVFLFCINFPRCQLFELKSYPDIFIFLPPAFDILQTVPTTYQPLGGVADNCKVNIR